MLTVDELRRQRLARARVNHETYKMLFGQASDRVRARANNKGTDLVWVVPPFVMGRPLYDPAHAARYVSDKLRSGGFRVSRARGQGVHACHVLYVTWSLQDHAHHATTAAAAAASAAASAAADPAPGLRASVGAASRSLEMLKARLRLG